MKYKGVIVLLILFLFFYINNYLHPMSFGDDYLYSFIWTGQPMAVPLPDNVTRVSSWSDLIHSQWLLYFSWGGRVIGQTLTQFFIWLGKDVFNFFNALAGTILVAELYWCSNKGNVNFNLNAGRVCFIFFSLWAFTPSFNPVFLWLTGACIYLWPAIFLLAFLLPYIRKYYDFNHTIAWGSSYNIGIFLLGVVAGCGNENAVCWIIIILFLFLFWYRNNRGKENWLYTGVTGLVIGYALLILAPGNMVRLYAEHGSNWFGMNVLRNNFTILVVVLTFQLVLWHFNIKSLYLIVKEKAKKIALYNDLLLVTVFCITSLLMTTMMLFSPFFPARSGFPGTVLLIISSAILLRIQNEYGVVLVPRLLKKFLFTVGVIYFIMTTYVTLQHSYKVHLWMNEIINEARQLQTNSSNEVLVIKPFKEPDRLADLLSGYHLSNFSLSDDMNDWRNVSFARYYSIKGIKISQ